MWRVFSGHDRVFGSVLVEGVDRMADKIPVTCPSCRGAIKVPMRLAGSTIECPGCEASFAVPLLDLPAAPVEPQPAEPIAPAPERCKAQESGATSEACS